MTNKRINPTPSSTTDPDKMGTNGEVLFWLTGEVKHLEKLKEKGVK